MCDEVTFGLESLRDVWRDVERLLPLHAIETGNMAGLGVDIDWERYFLLEEMGIARAVIARSGGAVVGYFLMMVLPHLHNRKVLSAVSDMYYLHPEVRGMAGLKLFRAAEQAMRELGVELAIVSCKLNRDYTPMFRRMGWQMDEHVFQKRWS